MSMGGVVPIEMNSGPSSELLTGGKQFITQTASFWDILPETHTSFANEYPGDAYVGAMACDCVCGALCKVRIAESHYLVSPQSRLRWLTT